MGDKEFLKKAKEVVAQYAREHMDKTDPESIMRASDDDVYCVWLVKALQNSKGLFSTRFPDGMYYEVTYNGDKDELYVDCYKKWENFCVQMR